jgi:threonine 3-dehydrogenase
MTADPRPDRDIAASSDGGSWIAASVPPGCQGGTGADQVRAATRGAVMKALVKAEAAPGLWLRDVPEPEAGPGEVKIRVLRTGICGTDLHVRAWDAWAASAVRTPVVLGHEIAGRVEAIGPGVDTVDVGDLVSVEGHIVCGRCRWCLAGRRQLCPNTVSVGIDRDGGYAEAVVVPATNVWRHRTPIDPDVAAIFDPFGNAVHSALAFDVLAEDVLITGAGPIGIMAASVVRHAGARNVVITDMSHERLALAESMGAVTRAVDVSTTSLPDVVAELGMVEGFDVGLEMSGAPAALRSMIAAMAHGGSIALLGLPSQSVEFDWDRVIHSMLTVKGIFGREMFETWYAMSVLVGAGLDISPVITHRFPYTEFEQAFDTAAGGHCGKVVIDWEVAS